MRRLLSHLARTVGLTDRLKAAWQRDVQEAQRQLRREWKEGAGRDVASLGADVIRLRGQLAELTGRLADMEAKQRKTERQLTRAALVAKLDEEQAAAVARLPIDLNPAQVAAHVEAAVTRTPLVDDPFPHCVVDQVFPAEVYQLVRRAIPPAAFFGDSDPIKQNLRIPIDKGPTLATRVWQFVDDVAHDAIVPAVTRHFAAHLARHYATVLAPALVDRALSLPQAPSGGRVMLRRPGYRLAPHRDPKRAVLTCLLYLAKPGDDEAYGTELYRVHDERESSYAHTYYPEEDGSRCELVDRVPYRPNTMLVFINGTGAHGATIPHTAPPTLERFAYQFYVGPSSDDLAALVACLPEERRRLWGEKSATPEAGASAVAGATRA